VEYVKRHKNTFMNTNTNTRQGIFSKGAFALIIVGALLTVGTLFSFVKFDSTHTWFAKIVHAATTLNTDPQDFATVRVSNYTDFPDTTTNWHSQIDADAGDIVSVTVYYHNTGTEDAENVIAAISVPTSPGTVINVGGGLSADNAVAISGQATINLTSSQHLTYIDGSAKWYPNQQLTEVGFPFGQSGDEFVGQGVNIGTIAPGWSTQGSVVARFQVSNDGATPPPAPILAVDLKAEGSDGPVTLLQDDNLHLSWTTSNASSCQFIAPFQSGVGTFGGTTLSPIHPSYPATSGTTYTIECNDAQGNTESDSVTVFGPTSPSQNATVDITANGSQGPVLLTQGQSFTLEWISSDVVSCSIGTPVNSGVATNGSAGPIDPAHPFYPATGFSNVFTITCVDGAGVSVSDSVTVSGPAPSPLPTAPTLTAQTGTQCGGTIDLSWNSVSGGDGYKIFRNGIHIITVSALNFTSNNLTPGTSHSYSVQAISSQGAQSPMSNTVTAVASAACPVGVPTVDITANGLQGPVTLSEGESFTLQWISSNVTSCTLSSANIFTSGVATNGSAGPIDPSHPFYPASGGSNVFVITCIDGLNQTATDNVVVSRTSAPVAPSVTLTANPSTISQGQNSTLSWTSANVDTCSATWTNATSTAGSAIVSPTSTTVYSITCTGNNGSATSSATVTVQSAPVCSVPDISSSLAATAKVGDPFSYTISATSSATTTISFSLSTSTLPAGLSFSGNTISGTPTSAGTFSVVLSASNNCGTSSRTLVITVSPAGGGSGSNNPSVTLTANPSTITIGATSTLSWTSSNANICGANWTTATSTSGSQDVAPTTTTVYSITCSNNTDSATSTAQVTVNPTVVDDGGNGGGGGGGGGGGRRSSGGGSRRSSGGDVLGETVSCDYLKDYLHINWQNNPAEMIKLQVFLKELEGFNNLVVTSVFDQQTFDAVAIFQVRYQDDILTPWGYADGEFTGFVYILTKKKINEIVCNKAFPLNAAQEEEIEQFRAFLENLRSRGIEVPEGFGGGSTGGSGTTGGGIALGGSTTTPTTTPIGNIAENAENVLDSIFGSSNAKNIAAAVFAGPQGWEESLNAILIFFAILLAIYLLVLAIVEKQNKDNQLTLTSQRTRKIFYFILGLIIAVIGALLFKFYAIVLPLIVLMVVLAITLLWFSLSKKEVLTLAKPEDTFPQKPKWPSA